MKEYKFRGWDVIGHKWVYGDLVHNQKVTRTGLEPRTMVGGYEVAPESVGLCTCHEDSMGNKLYEGDICSVSCYGRMFYAEILYVDIKGCFGYQTRSLFTPMDFVTTSRLVGNVYQNKELLERGT